MVHSHNAQVDDLAAGLDVILPPGFLLRAALAHESTAAQMPIAIRNGDGVRIWAEGNRTKRHCRLSALDLIDYQIQVIMVLNPNDEYPTSGDEPDDGSRNRTRSPRRNAKPQRPTAPSRHACECPDEPLLGCHAPPTDGPPSGNCSGIRPVPTPCRSKALPPALQELVPFEDEIHIPADTATCTVLSDAWHEGQFEAKCRAIIRYVDLMPRRICLADAAGPRVFSISDVSAPLTLDPHVVFKLVCPWKDFAMLADPSALPLHPNTRAALSLCHLEDAIGPCFHSGCCQLYVDGSAKKGAASWAVAVLWQCYKTGCTWFQGVFGATLCTNPFDDSFLGEEQCEAIHAEQTAVIYALLWVLQLATLCSRATQFVICFDNIAAGMGAGGATHLPQNSLLSKLARGAAHAVEACFACPLIFRHVKGHDGNPWNELCDVAAKHLLGIYPDCQVVIPGPPRHVPALVRSTNWDWAWHALSPDLSHVYPRMLDGMASWTTDFQQPCVQPDSLLPLRPSAPPEPTSPVSMHLRVMSLNVQSLKGKHRFLEEQAEMHACTVLFLQETKCDGLFCESAKFLRFEGFCGVHWGTAVWIDLQMGLVKQCLEADFSVRSYANCNETKTGCCVDEA